MTEVELVIFEYLTLAFGPLTLIWGIMHHTMMLLWAPKYLYQV